MSPINNLRNLRNLASKIPTTTSTARNLTKGTDAVVLISTTEPAKNLDTLETRPVPQVTKDAMQNPDHMAAFFRRTSEVHRAKEIQAAREAPYAYAGGKAPEFEVPYHDFDQDKAKAILGDQVMVIAGVGTLGRKLANLGAHFGMATALLDRPGSGMQPLADRLNKHFDLPAGSQAIGLEANLTNQEEVNLSLNQVANHFGRIDALFTTIGCYDGTPMVNSEWNHEKMAKLFEINAVTPMTIAHEAAPYLKQSPYGHIGYASTLATEKEYFFKEPKYAISKYAGHWLHKVAYEQLRKAGVGMSLHEFGPFRGPMAENRFDQSTLIDPSEAAVDMFRPLLLPPHTGSLERAFAPKHSVELRAHE